MGDMPGVPETKLRFASLQTLVGMKAPSNCKEKGVAVDDGIFSETVGWHHWLHSQCLDASSMDQVRNFTRDAPASITVKSILALL